MKYFNYLSPQALARLFELEPQPFSKDTPQEDLRAAVGALLYIPASNPSIADIIISGKIPTLTSMSICLEDSVGNGERQACIKNVETQLSALSHALEAGSLSSHALPLLFVRVRDNDMLEELAGLCCHFSPVLTGVILPKMHTNNLEQGLRITAQIAQNSASPFYAMPILESDELMLSPNRGILLEALRETADLYHDLILNIRVGATDLSGLYGLRRTPYASIHDAGPVAACLADIVRVFALRDRYTISGPVWEYFSAAHTLDTPELAGLLRELALDRLGGFTGKTCIHPAQLPAVQSSYAVPRETYRDAQRIHSADRNVCGVLPSEHRNKMNELRPHALWAEKTARQGRLFGVLKEGVDNTMLLRALWEGEAAR